MDLAQPGPGSWHRSRRIVAALSLARGLAIFRMSAIIAKVRAEIAEKKPVVGGYAIVFAGDYRFLECPFADGDVLHDDEAFLLATNPALEDDERVTVLELASGKVLAALTPRMARTAGLERKQSLSVQVLQQKLAGAGISLHGADYLFYFGESERVALMQENTGTARQLSQRDEVLFSAFAVTASPQDLDDAFVELDHWAVFGTFEQDRLVSAASAYAWSAYGWDGEQLADIGVLTLADFRGRGQARNTVRALARYAYEQGYHPQYRCQTDNAGSIALAKAAGLTLFGKWQVISPDCSVE